MSCDMIFAADTAKFGQPGVKLGTCRALAALQSACPAPRGQG